MIASITRGRSTVKSFIGSAIYIRNKSGEPKTVSTINKLEVKKVNSLINKAEKGGNKDYSNCIKNCLDESETLAMQAIKRLGPYRI